ncbi:ATP-binding protein [Aliikangiella coralliicola]|uniref:histidine kinase n=1 Tax=Aliikangiella coralliicola TaxID=2592383 RepID=A0A545UCY4_9GAMM|nr:ATP-binding protein [Aliikangiella coralliicola]TQV87293.1 hypothetical protein FLL46_12645 [Aliikangiella coralliicola]
MFKKKSLFWQLYFSVLGAIASIALLFIVIWAYLNQQSDTDDFYRDTQYAAAPILAAWNKQPVSSKTNLSQQDSLKKIIRQQINDYSFRIEIIGSSELETRLEHFKFLNTIGQSRIYQHSEDDTLASVQRLNNSQFWLVIADLDVDPEAEELTPILRAQFEQEIREDELSAFTVNIVALSLCAIIAIVLFLQINGIKKHLSKLVVASEQWAKGNLSARVDDALPIPLDNLANSYNSMAKELERSIAEQKVMAHAISHELRTPLSKIQLAMSLLERKFNFLTEEELHHDLLKYVDELENLVSKTLTLAKLNHSVVNKKLESFDINQLVADRINEQKRLHPTKSIQLTSTKPVQFEGDQFLLQMAIDNLLKNAFKYANKKINASANIDGNDIKITIEDDGKGISPESQEIILMPFSRVDESRGRDSGGFGLGLAIVDSIVRQHSGQIDFSNSSSGGLSVSITLPLI